MKLPANVEQLIEKVQIGKVTGRVIISFKEGVAMQVEVNEVIKASS